MRGSSGEQSLFPRSHAFMAIGAIWGSWLFAILLLALLHPAVPSSSVLGDLTVLVHVSISLIAIAVAYPPRIAALLGVSLAVRTALVFWDLHFSHVARIIHSGADSERFFSTAVQVSQDLSLLSEDVYGDTFTKMFGLLFHLIGPSRIFAQYTNALFGLTVALLVYSILREMKVGARSTLWVIAFAALLPNSLMLSAVFLRESVMAALIAASLLYFVRWFNHGGPQRIVVAVVLVIVASAFHAGVITVAVGYMFVALFYKRGQRRFRFGAQSLPYFMVFAAILAVTVLQYPDIFLGKFEQFESEAEVVTATNYRWGGSTYLTGLVVEDYGDLIRYGPLRALYFLASPMPWDFRGLFDALTFIFDSLFYLSLIVLAVRNLRNIRDRRSLVLALLAIIALASLVFGAGVSNAGTALRHRYKLLAVFLTLAALAMDRAPNAVLSGPSVASPSRRQLDSTSS